MSLRQDKPAYYMPLSASALKDGLTGPSPSVFSSAKVNYSKGTQDFVKLLMQESKLTSTQKQGFQAILRSGKSLPERPEDISRGVAGKGRFSKSNMNANYSPSVNMNQNRQMPSVSRRSLESIKASGALDPPTITRKYKTYNVEQEKARLAYRMTYGHCPTTEQLLEMENAQRGKDPKSVYRSRVATTEPEKKEKSLSTMKSERFAELVEEVKDRADFLKSMSILQQDKSYRTYIVYQMKEKISEMKTLCPQEVNNALRPLHLHEVDYSFAET